MLQTPRWAGHVSDLSGAAHAPPCTEIITTSCCSSPSLLAFVPVRIFPTSNLTSALPHPRSFNTLLFAPCRGRPRPACSPSIPAVALPSGATSQPSCLFFQPSRMARPQRHRKSLPRQRLSVPSDPPLPVPSARVTSVASQSCVDLLSGVFCQTADAASVALQTVTARTTGVFTRDVVTT